MAGRTRKSVLELDAGAGSMPGLAMAATTPLADFEAKETNREGLAELDRMTEASNRLTRAQKDRERIITRDASGPANAATKMRVPEFDEIRIDEQPAERTTMMQRSCRRTVPQIFIGETHVGGCDDLVALDRRGGLMPMLNGEA